MVPTLVQRGQILNVRNLCTATCALSDSFAHGTSGPDTIFFLKGDSVSALNINGKMTDNFLCDFVIKVFIALSALVLTYQKSTSMTH